MLKVIKVILVLFLMIVIISIPLAIFLVRMRGNSYLGGELKSVMIKYPLLVETLNLDEPGDGKYIYLNDQKPTISISVVSVNSKLHDEKINSWMEEMIKTTVKKGVMTKTPFDLRFEKTELLTDTDLADLYKSVKTEEDSDLYLIYTSSYEEKPTSVGLVIRRDAIFIFDDAIDKLSEKGYVEDLLEKTTIMHEWGHLLGVDHVNKDNCIMNEKAEVYDYPPVGKSLPTKYCWEELNNLDILRNGAT